MAQTVENLYANGLAEKISALNDTRKKIVTKLFTYIVLSILIIVCLYLYNSFYKYLSCILFFLIALVSIGKKFKKEIGSYKLLFKETVISPLTELVEGNLTYQPEQGIDKKLVLSSSLIKGNIDEYKSEDLFVGKIGETSFQFAEIEAKEFQKDSNGNSQKITIFKGLFLKANFNKRISSKVLISPDIFKDKWGKFGAYLSKKMFATSNLQKIKLEDNSFEKHFEVFSEDQVEARYVLSPSLMERFVKLREKGNLLTASFMNNDLYIGIYLNKNLFEPHLFRNTIKAKEVQQFLDYLIFMTEIVSDLNMNNRIYPT